MLVRVNQTGGDMNFYGLAMGAIMVLVIGLGHIIVIRWEYYWGAKSWPGMLAIGIGLVIASLLVDNVFLSGGLGLFGATFLWGIYELLKQRQRVAQGYPQRND